VFDFGDQPPANNFLSKDSFGEEKNYPLALYFCQRCNLVQLCDVVAKEDLYSHYVYFSSLLPTDEHFRNYAQEVISRFRLGGNSFVVEIGSNDGVMLRFFRKDGIRILGVDPAENVAAEANKKGIATMPRFWSEAVAKEIVLREGKADIIVGNNVVAHIDDYYDLLRGVRCLLSEKGVFIFEAPHFLDMFENLRFDTVYHEHLSYLSLGPLEYLFGLFGMDIFDVKIVGSQGTSLRVFAANRGAHPKERSVSDLLARERELGLHSLRAYINFADRLETLKNQTVSLLHNLRGAGYRIAGYGAPAKGNTLLNYYGIGPEILDYLTDYFPTKVGLVSPGMHIPVVHISEAMEDPPDYFLMLPWNYEKNILEKEEEYRKKGGKFIIPVGNDGVRII
jgi:hypothetical protein